MPSFSLLHSVDSQREKLGFLSVEATMDLASRGITILDPYSTLVSPHAALQNGVVLWPGVVVQSQGGSQVIIASGSVLFPGTRLVATHGSITIGAGVEIGEEGGFTIKVGQGDEIEIGDAARLLGGGSLSLSNRIGEGGQILGPIRCQNCHLEGGGSHRTPVPDERGGVLKGSGVARNITVPKGHVIQAFGLFADAVMRRQSYFHPTI